MQIISENLKHLIKEKAASLGFEKIGFAKYELLEKESVNLQKWLDRGYDADMGWMRKSYEKRRDVRKIMPDAKSIISLAYNYYTPFEHDEQKPKISRYAWGKDYHKVLKRKMKELVLYCEETFQVDEAILPGSEIASSLRSSQLIGLAMLTYVDDGPVMDKAWAVRAGIGWQGKHTNVINPDFGSWFFICSIITNIEFDSYDSPIEDLCGSCTLCMSACPTGAITDEYVVDSNKCISYQTIENRGEIPKGFDLHGWIFGCDVCQDVCPYNSPAHNIVTKDESFYPLTPLYSSLNERGEMRPARQTPGAGGSEGGFRTAEELNSFTEEQFNTIFADSPIKRTKYKGWKRNLKALTLSTSRRLEES